ncbi:MAG: NADH-quinone oxidoreductase subunit A [Planctomycetota bacterium]|jgi:NADH-quinone oxidoreductase subunit A
MYFDYLNLLVFATVGIAFVFVNVLVGSIIRPSRKTDQGLEVYECGEETIGDVWIKFDIRYYTVALIYVIFAVEIAFLFPWAMALNAAFEHPEIGLYALIKGLLFVTILFLGLASVWMKGDLDWVLSYGGKPYEPETPTPQKILAVEEIEAASAADADGDPDGDDPSTDSDEEAA